MRKIKYFAAFMSIILLCSVISVSLPVSAAFAPRFALNSEGVYMVNLDTDIAIVSKNADKKMYPASITKIMTAVVSLAELPDLDAYAEVPESAFDEFVLDFGEGNPNLYGASGAGIRPLQNNLTYRDLLYALMIASGCEAANILAYNVGRGNIERFVDMMNSTAEKIGCTNTHFSNPHGLFEVDNYTTPYDMYLITKYAMETFPEFMEICDTYSYDMPPNSSSPESYAITNTCAMIKPSSQYYYEGAHAVKTGSINEIFYETGGGWDWYSPENGFRTLVTTACKEGSDGREYTYMIVSMGAPFYLPNGEVPEVIPTYEDHMNLYDWAFEEFVYTDVVLSSQQVGQISVDKGKDADEVTVVTAEDFYTLLPKSLDKSSIQQVRNVEEMLEAPVEKGTEVGDLELRLDNETLAKIKLVTESDIELDTAAVYLERLRDVVTSPAFIIIASLLAVGIGLLTARKVMRRKRRGQAETERREKDMAASGSRNGRR